MTDTLHNVRASVLEEKDEQARRAVKAFRALQPTLTAYARILTKRKDVRVEMASNDNGSTDGKRIFFRPPMALGDNQPHQRRLCDRRDENLQQLCPACKAREAVLVTVYHEIAHICCESMTPPNPNDLKEMIEAAIAQHGTSYGRKIQERLDSMPSYKKDSYLGIADAVSPFLPIIINNLEDCRVNGEQFKARKGTRIMFEADVWDVFSKGVEQRDRLTGEIKTVPWNEYPLNMQVMVGLFCKGSGYDYSTFFVPKVIEALNDTHLTELVNKLQSARNVAAVYHLAFPILARLRELGYCHSPLDPEPEPEPEKESGNEDEQDDSGQPDPSDSPNEDGETTPSSGSDDGEVDESSTDGGEEQDKPSDDAGREGTQDSKSSGDSDSEDDSDDGDSDGNEEGSSEPDSNSDGDADGSDSDERETEDDSEGGEAGDESSDAEPADDNDSDSGGTGTPSSPQEPQEGDVEDAGSDEGEVGDGPDEGEREAGSGGDGQPREEANEATEGDDDDDSSNNSASRDDASGDPSSDSGADSTDLSGSDISDAESSDSDGEELGESGSDEDGGDDEGTSEGREGDLDSGDSGPRDEEVESVQPDDDNSTEQDDDPLDTGADEGLGGIEVIENEANDDLPMGDPEEVSEKLLEWMGHGEQPKSIEEEKLDNAVIDRAIVQGVYFEMPSHNIFGVREHKYGEILIVDGLNMSGAWDDARYGRTPGRAGKSGEFQPSEAILGPALTRMRVAFSENKRGHDQRHLKSGKVNAKVLGRRAPFNDDRLFKRRTLPGKRDYFVLIGMDVSGSTMGRNIVLEKQAVTAQAELCQRMGIKFAIYAHSGNLHAPASGRRLGMDLDIYLVKEPNEPWSNAVQQRLHDLGPDSCNLDGHTLEYYRKVLDSVTATDKIILYYTDGKMPAENYEEELEILQREIKTCAKRGYTLLGVGIRTDSPVRHGLDTVQVNTEDEVVKVVRHLEKRLLAS